MRALLLLLPLLVAACNENGGGDATAAPGTTPVHDIQGAGAESPFTGRSVTIEGIVTGDFQENDGDETRNLGGFYVQGRPDGIAETSDGVFAFDGTDPAVDVAVGDRVVVSGTVSEFFGETQVQVDTVNVVGSGVIDPTAVVFPAAALAVNVDGQPIADLERFEGMLVRFPQTLTVSQLRFTERFGEVLLTEGGRPYTYTNGHAPDAAGFTASRERLAARRIRLDDGRRDENPGRAAPAFRSGDTITNLTGVLRFSRGSGGAGDQAFRLMPTVAPEFEIRNPRPAAVADVAGELRVATINLNNWFSTVDDGSDACGPAGDQGCRGADSDEERSRQLARILTALSMIDADIVGLVELENNSRASLSTIVDALNRNLGATVYDFVDTGTIGTDAIKVGLIFQPEAVRPAGDFAILDTGVDARFDDDKNRPVLAQTFEAITGARFTVAVNHLKSKGSDCDAEGDPDRGDGQGNCSGTRTAAAAAMLDWLASDPTASGDPDVLIVGDFNAYAMEAPMQVFADAGWPNASAAAAGADYYSFEFDGQFGALDHAVASPSLAGQLAGAAEWHINADEAPWHDYNLEFGRDPAIFEAASPYRTSDHDPLIIGLDLEP